MEQVARVFPVKSKAALAEFGRRIDGWSAADKAAFTEAFGGAGFERWYYQEIDGKPYVLSVAEVEHLDRGYTFLAASQDPFTAWFREQVRELSGGFDLASAPMGPPTELVYEFKPAR